MIMLAGIYYGSQYGGSTTAILVNLPGEASSVVTAIDGYQMARKGRAGEALAVAAIGSFIAGCVSTLVVAGAAVPLTAVARQFGPAEYFSMMVVGLIASIAMASGSIFKALAMIVCGLALSMIGTDVNTGVLRYTFDIPELADGVDFVVLAMGIFGIGEILRNIETHEDARDILREKITGLWPGWRCLRTSFGAIARGTTLGSILGVLPGSGGALSSFVSYALEKRRESRRIQAALGMEQWKV
jgi:TctA family transporter